MKTLAKLPAAALLALAATGRPAAAGVDIHIAVPPPPSIVIPAPPRLVVVPTVPAVQYAPDLSYNYFAYGGRYYTLHDDAWFVASSYGGPWSYIDRRRVPRQIMVVPARYYRTAPSHRYYDDDQYRDEYRGHPHGMPPGQAKKYYRRHHHHHDDD